MPQVSQQEGGVRAGRYVARVDDKVTLKIGPTRNMRNASPDDSWDMTTAGKDYAIWERKE